MALARTSPPTFDPLRRVISPETLWITVLCLLDLATTLYWVSHGHAHEANPLLAHCLSLGSGHFVATKTAMFLPSLMVAEWYLPRNPSLVRRTLRAVMAAYVLIYTATVGAQIVTIFGL